MAEHIWEIVDNNFKKTPTANSLEVMVYFRGAADRCGLFSKIKALYGITEVEGDDYFIEMNLIVDYVNPVAFLTVDLTHRHYGFETMTYRLIDEYNKQLNYGQITCEENDIFYKKRLSWSADATSELLKDIACKAFDEVDSEHVVLERFAEEHRKNIRDGRKD